MKQLLIAFIRNPIPAPAKPLEHEKLGRFELFLVPVREDPEGYYYEAVFNRFRE